MKLYNLDHSPYATRVRIQNVAGNIGLTVEPPPVPLRTPEFSERFALGKIPVLELDDGTILSDSWVIMEYLEAVGAGASLAPAGALERAHMQALVRCADTCFSPAGLFPLFSVVANPGGDASKTDQLLDGLKAELARLDRLLAAQPAFGDRELHLGDIALAPHIAYTFLLAPIFSFDDPLGATPRLADWWEWVCGHEAVQAELDVMTGAAKAFFGG